MIFSHWLNRNSLFHDFKMKTVRYITLCFIVLLMVLQGKQTFIICFEISLNYNADSSGMTFG